MPKQLKAGQQVRRRYNEGFAVATPGHRRNRQSPVYELTGKTRKAPGGLQWECKRERFTEWIAQSRLEVIE